MDDKTVSIGTFSRAISRFFTPTPLRSVATVRPNPHLRFILPILICACAAGIGLAAAEVISRWIVERIAVNSYSVPRNPYKDRFWLAYTQPRPRPTDKLVIVITNSQGSFLEGKGEDCYSARLQHLLHEADPKHTYTVANWALPGSNAGEYALFSARAVDHHPDMVILASFSNNFGEAHTKHPLSFARNDVEQLGYLPSVRARLSARFIKHFKINRRRGKLAAFSSLMNLHESVAFWIRDPRLKEDRDWSKQIIRPPIDSEPVANSGREVLEEIHTVLHKGLPHTPVVLINMPLSRTKIFPESWPNTESFFIEAQRIFGDDPQFSVMDARDLVEPERYYSATHMDAQGHDQFARWLLPEVLKRTQPGESATHEL